MPFSADLKEAAHHTIFIALPRFCSRLKKQHPILVSDSDADVGEGNSRNNSRNNSKGGSEDRQQQAVTRWDSLSERVTGGPAPKATTPIQQQQLLQRQQLGSSLELRGMTTSRSANEELKDSVFATPAATPSITPRSSLDKAGAGARSLEDPRKSPM